MAEIGIRIRTRCQIRRAVLSICLKTLRAGDKTHDQQAGAPEKAPSMGAEDFFDLFGNSGGVDHATTSFAEDGRTFAMALAARLMAV